MPRFLFSLPVEHDLAYATCIARGIAAEYFDVRTTDGTVDSNLRALWSYEPEIFWSCGHGSEDVHTVECRNYFFVTGREPVGLGLAGGRIVHLLSCLCGKRLVPDLVEFGGAEAALGYSEEFVLGVKLEEEPFPAPCTPPSSEQDLYTPSDCDLEVQRALLDGRTVGEACAASRAKFDLEIERYETGDRSGWEIAPWMARWLLHDKNSQVLHERAAPPIRGMLTNLTFIGVAVGLGWMAYDRWFK